MALRPHCCRRCVCRLQWAGFLCGFSFADNVPGCKYGMAIQPYCRKARHPATDFAEYPAASRGTGHHHPQSSCSAVTSRLPTLVFVRPLTSGRAPAAQPTSPHCLPRSLTHLPAMAHVLADTRPRFNSYPTAINIQHAPAPKQYSSYHYAPATPANTPTNTHPSSPYPYRQASNPSHSRLASALQASSSRAPPVRTASAPNSPPLDLLGACSRSPLDQPAARGPRGVLTLAQGLRLSSLPVPAPLGRRLPRAPASSRPSSTSTLLLPARPAF
ncbi:hypothetical protein FS749_009480 [Ceratobasidium sp. UAMH 11750]|nr:hypothetical protein FS749_009480 [Ceratobasidium sp. UAMH 11750]